jgi:hypothetical protein
MVVELVHSMVVGQDKHLVHLIDYQALFVAQINSVDLDNEVVMFAEDNPMLFVVVDCLEEMKMEEHCKDVDHWDIELVDMVVD